ncbi:MAG TPA: Ig-like domain-containing protein [Chryseosolibacter sp.]|nr:Ig-like domain-containing protein [Chryseosolibacter sp.]
MRVSKNIHWFIYGLFVLACARQSSPTGGPKDTIPPSLISTIPPNESTNFNGTEIELLFNEMVQLDNPREELIINPSVGKDYKIEARKNSIIISKLETLQDSTTYTFNFRESVKDVTERNPTEGLRLALSTGAYIDSLSVKGTVVKQITQEPQKEITVTLTEYSDTFSLFQHSSTYFTQTNDKGEFLLENLKPGLYWLNAIDDRNKNLIADSKSEAYGFVADSILLDGNKEGFQIGTVNLDARDLKLTSARPYNTYFNIKLSKNARSIHISATDSSDLYYAFGTDRANIQVYNALTNRDSIAIRITATDSINNKIDTTLYAKFSEREIQPEKFTAEQTKTSWVLDEEQISTTIKFSKPLKEINFDSTYLIMDSATRIPFTQELVNYDEPNRELTLKNKVAKSTWLARQEQATANETPVAPAIIYLGKAAFISVENDSSTRLTQSIMPEKAEDLGIIIAETSPMPETQIIELLDKQGNIIRRETGKKIVTFSNLKPGEYQLRSVIDRNNNNQWDPGNYLTKTEPERITYYRNDEGTKVIKLNANWELGPLLITY